MLATVQADSLDELCQQTIPESIRLDKQMNLPTALSEAECLDHIAKLGLKNKVHKSYIGMGYHPTYFTDSCKRSVEMRIL